VAKATISFYPLKLLDFFLAKTQGATDYIVSFNLGDIFRVSASLREPFKHFLLPVNYSLI